MSTCQILSVDTAMDSECAFFAQARSQYYQSINDGPDIRVLGYAHANKLNLYSELQNAEGCHTVTISSHGVPSKILDNYDSLNGVLVSIDDPINELEALARNRVIYMLCCETATDEFSARLVQLGASGVIGFKLKPQWSHSVVQGLWRDFDLSILRLLIYRQSMDKVRDLRDTYINMIEGVMPYVDEYKGNDYTRMKNVISSMTIDD